MSRHEDKFVGFDVPRLWEDRSIIAFAAPSDSKRDGTANLVVTRDTPAPGETLDAYVDRQLFELSGSRDGFEQRDKQAVEISGKPGWIIHFASHGTSGPLEQRLVFAPLSDGQMLCITMTAPRADAPQLIPLFDHIVRSIALEPSKRPSS
jgi:hypothetical protein